MDTGCNTHDLLECECDSPDSQIPDDFVLEDGEDLAVGQGFVAASELRQEKLGAVDKVVRSCLVQGNFLFNMKISVFAEEKSRFSSFRGMDPYQLPDTFRW
jgi:hypothetical protein